MQDHGATPLHTASKTGNIDVVNLLLSYNKVDINKLEERSAGGYTALHYACNEGYANVARSLLEHGADPDLKADNTFGDTPLHICCKLNHIDCAKALLSAGADPDITDNFGHNASFWAYSRNHLDMIRELGLPKVASASAKEILEMMLQRNTNFKLPSTKTKKKKKSGKKKKGKRKTA